MASKASIAAHERRTAWRLVLPALPWTLAFFVVPFACMVAMSLWRRIGTELVRAWDLQNYAAFFAKPYFVEGLINSLEIAVVVTVVSAVLVYPLAWFIAERVPERAARDARAREMLDLVGLGDAFEKRPHELSGGQRQRVALARALAVEPDVLLLDEPLGALDLKLRRQMQDELKTIQRRVGTTFVHVTHDQDEAMAIADDIIVMNAGRAYHASMQRLYDLSVRVVHGGHFPSYDGERHRRIIRRWLDEKERA